MNIQEFIARQGGDAAVAQKLGVSHWAVRSWRTGTRRPRPAQAHKLILLSGGEVSLADLYGPRPTSGAGEVADAA